jgi:hypothetical protein
MANQWFRMYHEFADDPKVQRLSEVDQRRYVMLLCLRCKSDYVTSRQRHSDEDVTFALRISDDEWQKTKVVLMQKELIDEHNEPVNWDKRQYPSDSSAARTRAYRERLKTSENVTVTSQKRHSDALETETETETETEEIKEKNNKKESPKILLSEFGVEGQLADDFIKHRNSKKAPITKTVLSGFNREAIKAKVSIHEAIQLAIERGWIGFRADWYFEKQQQRETSRERNARERRDAIHSTDF